MPEINILYDPLMKFTVFLTALISNLRDEELFHFFHSSILTENVYWKLLKYKLTMLILAQNMQIFMELWCESLMWATCCWERGPIVLLRLCFLIVDRWPIVISRADGVKVYYIVLTLSGEIFAGICFCESNFPGILRGFNFARSLLISCLF